MAISAKSQHSFIGIILLAGLSFLAWISTYTGMLELIAANSGGRIGLPYMIAIGFSVFMLQLMILYTLDAMFSGMRWWLYLLYIPGYILLFVISVGFAFGFYWKYLEAGSEATLSAESSINRVQQALQSGQSRLEQLQTTLTALSAISTKKAEDERSAGGTCPNSRAGDGPRRRLREGDAQRFQFANDYIGQRTSAVKADIAALNADLAKVLSNDPGAVDPATGNRNPFLRELDSKLGLTTTRFNALRTDPQLLQVRDEFAKRAGQSSFPDDKGGAFACPDPQLQSALNGVVRSIDNLPTLEKPDIAAVEGSQAVVEAFRRLTNSGINWVNQTGASIGGLFGVRSAAPPPRSGLSERDYISLFIAIFVDFCILLISINRPFGPIFDLFRSVEEAKGRKMDEFLTIFYQVFQDEFHREPRPLEVFEPLQDVVFDHRRKYFAAVPLNFRSDSSPQASRYIANIFVALEGHDFVALVTPKDHGLDKEEIKNKLSEHGSDYAQAGAFRLYVFKKGAWSDIVMRSVVSAAHHERHLESKRARARGKAPADLRLTAERVQEEFKGDVREISGETAAPQKQIPGKYSAAGQPGKTTKLLTQQNIAAAPQADDDVRQADPDPFEYNKVADELERGRRRPARNDQPVKTSNGKTLWSRFTGTPGKPENDA